MAQQTKAESSIVKEVSRTGSHGFIGNKTVSDPLLKTIEKPDMSEVLEIVSNVHNRDTLSRIWFSV